MSKSTVSSESGKKNRRKRTSINGELLECLEKFYRKNSRPDRCEMRMLALEIGQPHNLIRIWFQNRRAKHRREIQQKQQQQQIKEQQEQQDDNIDSNNNQRESCGLSEETLQIVEAVLNDSDISNAINSTPSNASISSSDNNELIIIIMN
ncbi:hypothetical protein Ahia01_000155500 [Argonauta hians]